MRRAQLRGGARWPHARRTRVGGVRGHVWAPQTKVRRPDYPARYVARRARGPYFRRWALIIALRGQDDLAVVTGLHHRLVRARGLGERELLGDDGAQGAVREPFDGGGG